MHAKTYKHIEEKIFTESKQWVKVKSIIFLNFFFFFFFKILSTSWAKKQT